MSVAASNGSIYITWFESSASANYILKMQRLASDGTKQWGSSGITVSSFPQNSALYGYDLTSDYEGNAIVASRMREVGILIFQAESLDNIYGTATI